MPLSLTGFVAVVLAYEAAIRVWSGKARVRGCGRARCGPGGWKCQGHKPSFIRAWREYDDPYCLCNSFSWGGSNYLWETVSKHRKRSQVRSCCGHLLAVKSTYTLWHPHKYPRCFITTSVVWMKLTLNDRTSCHEPTQSQRESVCLSVPYFNIVFSLWFVLPALPYMHVSSWVGACVCLWDHV